VREWCVQKLADVAPIVGALHQATIETFRIVGWHCAKPTPSSSSAAGKTCDLLEWCVQKQRGECMRDRALKGKALERTKAEPLFLYEYAEAHHRAVEGICKARVRWRGLGKNSSAATSRKKRHEPRQS
jgi:hypothetical protein